jgi:hypothetical protein
MNSFQFYLKFKLTKLNNIIKQKSNGIAYIEITKNKYEKTFIFVEKL